MKTLLKRGLPDPSALDLAPYELGWGRTNKRLFINDNGTIVRLNSKTTINEALNVDPSFYAPVTITANRVLKTKATWVAGQDPFEYLAIDTTPTLASTNLVSSDGVKVALNGLQSTINTALNDKVDKIPGYGLSKNDFTDVLASWLDQDVSIGSGPTFGAVKHFVQVATPAHVNGQTWYDGLTLWLDTPPPQMRIPLGQGEYRYVRNETGATILASKVIYPYGNSGNLSLIDYADARDKSTLMLIGLTIMDIPNNSNGWVCTSGGAFNQDTSQFAEFSVLYLDSLTPGLLTTSLPDIDSYTVVIGVNRNTHATEGAIGVQLDVSADTVETHNQNGFPAYHQADIDLTYVQGTRTFTITPTSSLNDFHFYVYGNKFRKEGIQTLVLSAVAGQHFIYYDENGDLQELVNETGAAVADIFVNNCAVGYVYLDNSFNALLGVGMELHGHEMSPSTHSYLHRFFGAQFGSGAQLGNIVKDATTEQLLKVSLSEAIIADEDINHVVKQRLLTDTIEIVYNVGSDYSDPVIEVIASAPGHIFTPGVGGSAQYNEWTGSVWKLTECPEGDFILAHIFATNSIDSVDIKKRKFIVVMGQEAYDKGGDGKAGAAEEISRLVSTLPFPEMVPIATVLIEVKGANNNTLNAKIKEVGQGELFIDWRGANIVGSGGSIGGTHSDLLARDASNSHPSQAISYDPTISNMTATDVKAAIDELKAILINATISLDGLMSKEDKHKLDTIYAVFGEFADADSIVNTLTEVLSVFENYPEGTNLLTILGDKVDKVAGKELSANDFTDLLKTKLDEIAAGAEVNVQSDWNVTDTGADEFIKNKPVSIDGIDGDDLGFDWQGTSLGINVNGGAYSYVDLEGPQGIQGIQGFGFIFNWIGTTLGVGTSEDPGVYIPYVDLQGPQGIQGVIGVTGDQGIQGIAGDDGIDGDQGIQGIQGIQGVQGEQGVIGLTGDTGAQGYGFIYEWAGTQLGVGTSENPGSYSYVDLKGEQGIQGIQGPAGTDGIIGVDGYGFIYNWSGTSLGVGTTENPGSYDYVNLKGEQGIQGIQGITGDDGIQGIQGIQGVTGDDGADGSNGTDGDDLGFLWGTGGNLYKLGVNVNGGAYTYSSSLRGAQGIQGIQGVIGITGDQGIQGIQGVQGDPMQFVKTYVSVAAMNADYGGTQVNVGELVIIASGNPEDVDNSKVYVKGASAYTFVADLSGAEGVQGPQGIQGIQGIQGVKGDDGDQGIQGIQGIQGVKGDTGDDGADGTNGTNGSTPTLAVGTVSTGAAGSNVSITNGGTALARTFNFIIPRGDTGIQGIQGIQGVKGDDGADGAKGDKGDTGNTGAAATLSLGTVATGAAGSNVSITQGGTSAARTFNFTIPRGDTGIQGIQGIQGETGADSTVQGPQGIQGIQGIQGNPGTDASVTLTNVETVTFTDFSNSTNAMNIDGTTRNHIGYVNGSIAAGYADGGAWTAAYGSTWQSQIFVNFRDGAMAVRGKNSGTWQPWRFVLDTVNFNPLDYPDMVGPQGLKGDTGDDGVQGIQGIQGIQGVIGLTGADGDDGADADLLNPIFGSGTQVWQQKFLSTTYELWSGTGTGTKRMSLNNAGILDVAIKDQRDSTAVKFWTGTQAQYDAIGTPSSDILYFITE